MNKQAAYLDGYKNAGTKGHNSKLYVKAIGDKYRPALEKQASFGSLARKVGGGIASGVGRGMKMAEPAITGVKKAGAAVGNKVLDTPPAVGAGIVAGGATAGVLGLKAMLKKMLSGPKQEGV